MFLCRIAKAFEIVWIFYCACLIARVAATCDPKRCTLKQYHYSKERHSVEGHALIGHVFQSLIVSGHKNCFEHCVWDCRCISFNYLTTASQDNCQLNRKNRHLKPSSLKPKEGFSYNDIEIDYNVETGATCTECHNGCCHSNPCQNGGTCHEICNATKKRFKCSCRPGYKGNVCGEVSKNCAEVKKHRGSTDEVYTIDPDGLGAFDVFCDQNTTGGAWAVFQRRLDGSVVFYRGWEEYKRGFGNQSGEFWLGLEKIHRLTNQTNCILRVELEDFNGFSCSVEYDRFAINGENQSYSLASVGTFSGSCVDSLTYSLGAFFSTKDRDLDSRRSNHCAVDHEGAWWYKACTQANLNGQYFPGIVPSVKGIYWYKDAQNKLVLLKKATMKLKPYG